MYVFATVKPLTKSNSTIQRNRHEQLEKNLALDESISNIFIVSYLLMSHQHPLFLPPPLPPSPSPSPSPPIAIGKEIRFIQWFDFPPSAQFRTILFRVLVFPFHESNSICTSAATSYRFDTYHNIYCVHNIHKYIHSIYKF